MSGRCPKTSHAWRSQCDLKAGHEGLCESAGDAFSGREPIRGETVRCLGCDREVYIQHALVRVDASNIHNFDASRAQAYCSQCLTGERLPAEAEPQTERSVFDDYRRK